MNQAAIVHHQPPTIPAPVRPRGSRTGRVFFPLFLIALSLLLLACGPSDDPCVGSNIDEACSDVVVEVTTGHGFDTCDAPTVAQMQTWWEDSPYSSVGIYIGGVMRACNQANLDSDWIADVGGQGWTFIPTWVGPQAPCSNFSQRFSYNVTTAAQQGRDEAQDAIAAMEDLGMMGDYVIYYDLEGYGASSSTSNCQLAVNAFLEGWTDELQDAGHKAGVYGSSCNSGGDFWEDLTPTPDDAWFAHWIYNGYNNNATVWNVACVANNEFDNHERIRQYAGDFHDSWGTVQLYIDANVLDGEVVGLAGDGDGDPFAQPKVDTVKMVSSRFGYVLSQGTLAWTADGGVTWTDFATVHAAGAPVAAVDFRSERRGVVALAPAPGAADAHDLTLLSTVDGGRSWDSRTVTLATEPGATVSDTFVQFVDDAHGWLGVRYASGINFSHGALWRTTDGGATWTEMAFPIADPVTFINATDGWLAGGPNGGQLYATTDGGRTWQPLTLRLAALPAAAQLRYATPTFTDAANGVLPVTIITPDGAAIALFTTDDGGATWTETRRSALANSGNVAAMAPVAVADDAVFVAEGRRADVMALDGGPFSGYRTAQLPGTISAVSFASADTGFAVVTDGTCWGNKEALKGFYCGALSLLFRTDDGGRTWDVAGWNLTPDELARYLADVVALRAQVFAGLAPVDDLIAVIKEVEPGIMEQIVTDPVLSLQLSHFLMTGETTAENLRVVVVTPETFATANEVFAALVGAFPDLADPAKASWNDYIRTYVVIE